MDLLKRGCSGSNLCRFTKIFQRACLSILAHGGCLPKTSLPSIHQRPFILKTNISSNGPCPYSTTDVHRLCHTSNMERMKFSNGASVTLPRNVVERLNGLLQDIRKEAEEIQEKPIPELERMYSLTRYSFLEGGKLIRPKVVLLMAGATHIASHSSLEPQCKCSSNQDILDSQYKIALISEMLHTASLIHDDVIDESDERRGRPTLHAVTGNKLAIMTGDYILAKATQLLASLQNPDVVVLLSQVIEDLVKGEFMQLGSRDLEEERFSHYIMKCFKKTASLFAYSCKAVSVLATCPKSVCEMAYEYGRHLGIAFQLIDDALDFLSQSSVLGKPAAADLRLGIATGPVLFAARQHPALTELILRRFSRPGDVQLASELVQNSDGVSQTKALAEMHCQEAVRCAEGFPNSDYKDALIKIASSQVSREK